MHGFVKEQSEIYEKRNNDSDLIRNYCAERAENLYFSPAIFMSGITDKLDGQFDNDFENRIVLGGWNTFSKTFYDKLSYAGIGEKTIEQSMMEDENTFLISNELYFTPINAYLSEKYGENYSAEVINGFNIDSFGCVYIYKLSN